MKTLFYALIFNVVTKCKETMHCEFVDGILMFCWCRCSVMFPTLDGYLATNFFKELFFSNFVLISFKCFDSDSLLCSMVSTMYTDE